MELPENRMRTDQPLFTNIGALPVVAQRVVAKIVNNPVGMYLFRRMVCQIKKKKNILRVFTCSFNRCNETFGVLSRCFSPREWLQPVEV